MHSRDATDWCRFDPPGGARVAQREVDEFERLEATHPHGVYPATAVRRISLIKSLMDEGMTLEDIRHSFIFFRGQLDGVERALDDLFAALDKAIAENGGLKASRRRELERMLNDGRHKAHQFVKEIERTVSQITARQDSGKGDR